MSDLILYLGNKNYSSWSFRPWIAMEAAGVPFTDRVIPFDFAGGNPEFKTISPTGKVPVLHHGAVRVWESLAIIEYVAELFPDAGIWPKDRPARSRESPVRDVDGNAFRFPGVAQCLPDEHPPHGLRGGSSCRTVSWTMSRGFRGDLEGTTLSEAPVGRSCSVLSPQQTLCIAPVVNRFEAYYDLVTDEDTLRGYMAAYDGISSGLDQVAGCGTQGNLGRTRGRGVRHFGSFPDDRIAGKSVRRIFVKNPGRGLVKQPYGACISRPKFPRSRRDECRPSVAAGDHVFAR